MLAVKNFFLPERSSSNKPQQQADGVKFSRMPETFLRSIRRRSLRVKRTKSLMVAPDRSEKRKSGMFFFFLLVGTWWQIAARLCSDYDRRTGRDRYRGTDASMYGALI